MDSTNQQKTQILVKKGYRILAQNFGTHFPQTLSPRKTHSFKHAIKNNFFNELEHAENDCFLYYTKRRGQYSSML